ncbi:hypothetical protein MNBD_PLANCTO02-668 [hydrothermal vent metagenome]|uniref:DUF2062 domain-containing protein n=1 Tax=hydrothermal vent metagenome TaxID=652676 RepID=A0A3B1DRT6_9ZZZZ
MTQKKQKTTWWKSPRALFRQILMLDDTAHSIALGTTIGMFIGMTPTVGAQMILVVIFAFLTKRLFRFNQVAALLTVYVSNPITTLPIYWFNYKVGTWFLGGKASHGEFAKALEYKGFEQWWETIVTLYVKFGYPLLIGSLIVAVICSAITYPTIIYLKRKFAPTEQESDNKKPVQ